MMQPAAAKEQKSICVIAEIAHQFQLKKIGFTIFSNEDTTVPIESWKLDEKIYAKSKALLGKDFAVKQIAAPREVFQPLHEQRGPLRDTAAELKEMVRKAAAGSSCDYYLVPVCGGSQVSNTNQSVTGLGVVEMGNDLVGYNREIYALSYIHVYDGKTFEVLRSEQGGSDKPMFFQLIRGPSQAIDFEAHPSLQAVADDPKTRDIVWNLMARSLDLTLPKLFEIEALETAAKHTAETAKAKAAKKDDWAPF